VTSRMHEEREDRSALSDDTLIGIEILSIDVFDTLLRRSCGNSRNLWAGMETPARRANLLSDELPEGSFAALRAMLESRARQRLQHSAGHGEVTLAEIYAELPSTLGNAGGLAALELEWEKASLVADPGLVALIARERASGRHIWLISDTYYTSGHLAGLLTAAGVPPASYDRLVTSCDEGASKEKGSLFAHLIKESGIAPEKWLHVGDNPQADQVQPTRLGIRAHLWRLPPGLAEIERRESLIGGGSGPYFTLRRLVAGSMDVCDIWEDLGRYVIGPALVGFAHAVLDDCTAQGIRRVAPLEREGTVFTGVLRFLAEARGLVLDIRPVAVSRAGLFLPTASVPDLPAIARLAGNSTIRTLRSALALYGECNPPEPLQPWLDRALVDFLGEGGAAVALLEEFLAKPEVKARIGQRIAKAREAAIAYFEEQLGPETHVITMDLGAQGTIQYALGQLLKESRRFRHHLLYAVDGLLPRLADGHTWRPFCGLEPAALARGAVIYRGPQLLELPLVSGRRSTVGYGRDATGRPLPLFDPVTEDPGQARDLARCQAAILDVARRAATVMSVPALAAGLADQRALAASVLTSLYRLIQMPTSAEAQAGAALVYDYNDGTDFRLAVSSADALEAVAGLDFLDPAGRLILATKLRPSEVPWPQGTLTVRDADQIVGLYEAISADGGHEAMARLLLRRLHASGCRRVVLCGAGGMGGMAPAMLALGSTLEIVAYIDYFPAMLPAGDEFLGVPVVTMDRVAALGCHDFAVLSMGYADAIIAQVQAALGPAGKEARFVSLVRTVFPEQSD